ncbi:hypothetical protein V6N13_048185 [Hibiscus sabdariffa]|uniref:Uncharacterized protein n=1 Tax=Hibiscus sabdariffa TaxID=183260 RepID=A0ABR2F6H0_9ROSI
MVFAYRSLSMIIRTFAQEHGSYRSKEFVKRSCQYFYMFLLKNNPNLFLREKDLNYSCRALPRREPFQKFSKAGGKPRPKRGFGNSFQPALDAPRLEPHELRHCPKRKDALSQSPLSYFIIR